MKLCSQDYDDYIMAANSQYCLRWNNHQTNLVSSLGDLLLCEAFTDVTVACEDGVTLQAHRVLLASCSSYFHDLFMETLSKSSTHPIVVLKDVRSADMKLLLKYMYRGEVNVQQESLKGLLKVAESLKIRGLVEGLASEQLAGRQIDSSTDVPRTEPLPLDRPSQHESPRRPSSPSKSPKRQHSPQRPSSPPTHYPAFLQRPQHYQSDHQSRETPRKEPQHPQILQTQAEESRELHPHLPLNLGTLPPHVPRPESPPNKLKRTILPDQILSPTPLLSSALGHPPGYPGDMSSFVSLASSIMPLPGLLPSHVPPLLSHNRRELEPPHFGISVKKDLAAEEDMRLYPDVKRDEDPPSSDKILSNGSLLPDFPPYPQMDVNNTPYNTFVNYVQNPKPEWKRYKQYTKTDLMEAIQAVKNGMTALQASRKYKVPSRTLYDKIKKMGIHTLPRRIPSKRPHTTDLEGSSDTSAMQTDSRPGSRSSVDPGHTLDQRPNSRVDMDHSHILRDYKDEPITDHDDDDILIDPSGPVTPINSYSLSGHSGSISDGQTSPCLPLDLTDPVAIGAHRTEVQERA